MSPLSNDERGGLLSIARSSIIAAVSQGARFDPGPGIGALAERAGAFVTIHYRGKLRGCVGQPESRDSLAETVSHCAAMAALEDDRFRPVSAEEIPELSIDISVLSPMRLIRPEEIEIGRHGLFILLGSARGLLLPQVAVEHHLTTEQFLAETCRKAGLPRDAWKSPAAKILGFAAEIFSELDSTSPEGATREPALNTPSK